MRVKLTRAPDSRFFAYQSMPKVFRDLGDFVIWFAGWQLTIWYKD